MTPRKFSEEELQTKLVLAQSEIEVLKAKLEAVTRSAQWTAFNKMLNWLNAQEGKVLEKKTVYAAVMEMRPE